MDEATRRDLALLLMVGPGLAGRSRLLAEALAEAWPGHPGMFLALPPGTAIEPGPEAIRCEHAGWVSMLREALLHIRACRPSTRHVMLLIDDHCPLRPCDAGRLGSVLRAALAEGMKCTSFVTYPWPWTSTEPDSVDERGRRMTWREIAVKEAGGHRFALVPPDFFRYNQCQPSLWDLDYGLSLCDRALDLGIDDPWSFESLLLPDQPQHYVSDYRWPTVHHGFMAAGRVNPEAVLFAEGRSPAALRLKQALVEDFRRERGALAVARLRAARLFQGLRRPVGRMLRRAGIRRA